VPKVSNRKILQLYIARDPPGGSAATDLESAWPKLRTSVLPPRVRRAQDRRHSTLSSRPPMVND